MIRNFIGLDRIRSKEEYEKLLHDAIQESHGVYFPTHAVRKSGELIGYFSVGAPQATLVFAWLGTKVTPRESFTLINTIESIVSSGGGKAINFPVPKTSPFHSLMESMGYKNVGSYDVFIKEL